MVKMAHVNKLKKSILNVCPPPLGITQKPLQATKPNNHYQPSVVVDIQINQSPVASRTRKRGVTNRQDAATASKPATLSIPITATRNKRNV
jgi:hypothetical protein